MTKHNGVLLYYLEVAVNHKRQYFSKDSLFYSWYTNKDGSLKTVGDLIKRPEYSQFLSFIAENGINEFYNGTIADEIIEEVWLYKITIVTINPILYYRYNLMVVY